MNTTYNIVWLGQLGKLVGKDGKLKLDDCNVAMEMHKYTGKKHMPKRNETKNKLCKKNLTGYWSWDSEINENNAMIANDNGKNMHRNGKNNRKIQHGSCNGYNMFHYFKHQLFLKKTVLWPLNH